MNRRNLVLLAIAALALLAWLFFLRSPGYEFAQYPPTATGPWVAFGDSLTAGLGASPGQDYPALLGQRLGLTIINRGRSGDTTEDGLRRVDEVRALNPRVVLLCLGGNDGLQKVEPAVMLANLGVLIDRFQEGGAFVVLIGVRSVSLLDRNDKPFRQLARQKRVLYVPDIFHGIFLKPIYMADALHPNDAGYALITERLEAALRPVLAGLR